MTSTFQAFCRACELSPGRRFDFQARATAIHYYRQEDDVTAKPGQPRGSPVQYQLACVTRHRVLYGRPSRSPWQSSLFTLYLAENLAIHAEISKLGQDLLG